MMYGWSSLAAHIQSITVESNGKKSYNKFVYIKMLRWIFYGICKNFMLRKREW